ncbi:MAG: DUF6531 domain-containing protein, partial [Phenylobacterium sp.]
AVAPPAVSARPTLVSSGFVAIDGVNLRNGNFSLTYPAFDRGRGVAYRRTYNSLAKGVGVFGRQWGSTFDTRLVRLGADRMVVIENGNGALVAYGDRPPGETSASLELAVAAARERPADALSASPGEGDVGRLDIDPATTIGDSFCATDALYRAAQGVWRLGCNRKREVFDSEGRVLEYMETWPGPRGVGLTWAGDRLISVTATPARFLSFRHGARTLTVTNEANDWVRYEFDAQGRNIAVRNSDGVSYRFRYDRRSRLIDIAFVDTTHRRITYDEQNRVTLIRGRNGETTTFLYRTASGGRQETEVVRTARTGAATSAVYVFGE